MSSTKKSKGFMGTRPGHYLSIGSSLFGAVSAVKQVRKAKQEGDRLRQLDAALSIAAIATTIALLVRELRRMDRDDSDTDVLAD